MLHECWCAPLRCQAVVTWCWPRGAWHSESDVGSVCVASGEATGGGADEGERDAGARLVSGEGFFGGEGVVLGDVEGDKEAARVEGGIGVEAGTGGVWEGVVGDEVGGELAVECAGEAGLWVGCRDEVEVGEGGGAVGAGEGVAEGAVAVRV